MRKAVMIILITLAGTMLVLGTLSYVVPTQWGVVGSFYEEGVSFGFYNGWIDLRIRQDVYSRTAPYGNRTVPYGNPLRTQWPKAVSYAHYQSNTWLLGRFTFRLYEWPDYRFRQNIAPTTMVPKSVRMYLMVWSPFLFWFVSFATYPLVALNYGRLRRLIRRMRGVCIVCCYNLTGNVSGVCPECGTSINRKSLRELIAKHDRIAWAFVILGLAYAAGSYVHRLNYKRPITFRASFIEPAPMLRVSAEEVQQVRAIVAAELENLWNSPWIRGKTFVEKESEGTYRAYGSITLRRYNCREQGAGRNPICYRYEQKIRQFMMAIRLCPDEPWQHEVLELIVSGESLEMDSAGYFVVPPKLQEIEGPPPGSFRRAVRPD
ncbi:MAG: hypothetical protein JSU63_12680 [Phycisphaerales bacterium]|nr:MAG: hypothetical protein JSU63_12680 [Phycisphaerales bacterium]